MTYFGRTFELADGTMVEPCPWCGAPCFEPDLHTCAGLLEDTLERMNDND